jgi:hypothetical protein
MNRDSFVSITFHPTELELPSATCSAPNSTSLYLHQTEIVSVEDARVKARLWKDDFNDVRPHSSLGYLTPSEFARRCAGSAPFAARTPLHQHSEKTEPLPVS